MSFLIYCKCTSISTHSLTKRLTYSTATVLRLYPYFNSQPHEEADWLLPTMFFSDFHFNSQPHEEADLALYDKGGWTAEISTHSLTKRLTA